eukprot:scaffold127777_cov69-Phaeocystis_antarctica.AAC.1
MHSRVRDGARDRVWVSVPSRSMNGQRTAKQLPTDRDGSHEPAGACLAEGGRPNPDPNQQARGEGCRRCGFEARGRLGKERVGVAHERRARADEGHASHAQPDDRRLGAGRHNVLDSGRLPAVARCWAAGRGSVVGVTTNLYNPSAAYSARRLGCLALSNAMCSLR